MGHPVFMNILYSFIIHHSYFFFTTMVICWNGFIPIIETLHVWVLKIIIRKCGNWEVRKYCCIQTSSPSVGFVLQGLNMVLKRTNFIFQNKGLRKKINGSFGLEHTKNRRGGGTWESVHLLKLEKNSSLFLQKKKSFKSTCTALSRGYQRKAVMLTLCPNTFQFWNWQFIFLIRRFLAQKKQKLAGEGASITGMYNPKLPFLVCRPFFCQIDIIQVKWTTKRSRCVPCCGDALKI